MSKNIDASSIELWRYYRRQPYLFAQLPEAWQLSVEANYNDAMKRMRMRQRRKAIPVSIMATLAAVTASKAKSTAYTTTLTGTTADTAYQSGTDANGNLVYRLIDGDSIGVTANGTQNVAGIGLQSGTPKVVLQVGADGKGALTVSAIRPAAGTFGSAYAIDVEAGGNLTVNGNTSTIAQTSDPWRYVNGQWTIGSEGEGLHLDRATATFNGNLDVNTKTVAWSKGLWIYRGFLTVNGNTTIVTHGPGTDTAGIYNSGGGTGNVVFNGNLGIVSYGDWPNDTVQGIYNDNVNTRITVNGDLNVAATSNGSTVMGIRNQGTMYVTGNVTITSDGPRSAFGVNNTHASARFHVGGDLTVTVTSHTNYNPFGSPTALGNTYGHTYGSMTLDGAVDARVSGVSTSFAVNNNSVMTFTNAAKTAVLRTSVDCAACDAYGVANNGGSLTLAGGLDVAVSNTGSGARYAIWNVAADGWQAQSPLSVNQAGGQSVKVDGDVLTQNLVNAAGTHFIATTQLNFNDDASFLKGMVLGGSGTTSKGGTLSAGVPILAFANGARWMPTGTSTLASDFGAGSLSLGNGSAIDMAGSWGTFAQGSVPTHSLRNLSVDSSTGGATVNLTDGATFTLLSDIRNAQADHVSFGAGIATFNATGTQQVRIAYDPVLDDTSWVNANAIGKGVTIAAPNPIVIVDASAAANGTASFPSVAGLTSQWGTTYENALVRYSYVPVVSLSADHKQILLTGIDIIGNGSSTGGSTGSGSTTGTSTPPSSGSTGTGSTASTGGSSSTTPPVTPPNTSTGSDSTQNIGAMTPSTGVLVAGDAALALANAWQIDDQAISRRSESGRLSQLSGASGAWVDTDVGDFTGQSSDGRSYRQHQTSASFGAERLSDFDGGRNALGMVYTHTQSHASLQNGSADVRADSIGVYDSWNSRNGVFADAVARVGQLRDSYTSTDAFGSASGHYRPLAASVSARAGWRYQADDGGYVEPQVQAAYGSIGSSSYVASDQVHFDVSRNHAFLTRAGVLIGQAFTPAASIKADMYLRASAVHAVGSRPNINASLDGGAVPVGLPSRHGTAGEVAVGMHLALAGRWSVFAEAGQVSKSDAVPGGWRASAGVRASF
ncbi:autotransporter outer membrane beta-barrel domain-containing protein [Dyella sp.]|uniref:autotransporter outer membrane beta-barrel domain-containing protein n=1 Tax=Dyella sp. TaxID=1869338 RepID=UPI002B48AC3F|nr:autotransporter outer membrane beta-barrel domain-containing protein [Dyella sp.]HKT27061.1 autotransporter outer membrane beta-barrel domain-containing protein [Dyella sp.]